MFVLLLSYWSCSRLWKLWQPESFLAWFMQAPVWIGGYPQSKQHSIIFNKGINMPFQVSFRSLVLWFKASVYFGLHKLAIVFGPILQHVGVPSFWIIVKEINGAKLPMKRHSLYSWDSWWQPWNPLNGVLCLHAHLLESKCNSEFQKSDKKHLTDRHRLSSCPAPFYITRSLRRGTDFISLLRPVKSLAGLGAKNWGGPQNCGQLFW